MIPQTSPDTKILDWAKRVQEKYKVPADNFTVSYYDTVYMLKSIIEKVGCDKPAIRDALAATKSWKGMLISGRMSGRSPYTRSASIATRARHRN
jgi:branched-chain amino acid transport system substrate-binding protein